MHLRRLALLAALALGVVTGPVTSGALGTPSAEAGTRTASRKAAGSKKAAGKSAKRGKTARRTTPSSKRTRSARAKRGGKRGKTRLCTPVKVGKGKRARTRNKCTFVRTFSGHGVAAADLRTTPLERPSGDVWVYAENLGEEARVNIYRPDGAYDEEALARLDEIFRCKRTHEVRALDPRLYEQLSRIQDHFGGVRASVVSGFRFAERSSSRHFHASAIDIRLEGVGIRDMYSYAQSLDGGGMGMGIYPHSGFIHVDYRAPGEPSYRWTDYSGPGGKAKKAKGKGKRKAPGRTARAKRPTS